jgi:hypothetical protein
MRSTYLVIHGEHRSAPANSPLLHPARRRILVCSPDESGQITLLIHRFTDSLIH